MGSKQTRRDFIKNCTKYGCEFCLLSILNNKLFAADNFIEQDIIDLSHLSYCGIDCEKCDLFKATKENDVEQKRKIYYSWGWKEKFGIDYDPEKVFCFGCKPDDKPLKIGMAECTVRICTTVNNIESCIKCKKLKSCEKELWKKWPEFYKNVIKLQGEYITQPGAFLSDINQ